jgi:hypothetical protein
MMRRAILLPLWLAVTAPLSAQDPEVRREMLQQQVVQRFLANYRAQAGLTDGQFEQFREVTRRSFEARADLARRERGVWLALEAQMRPGVAANPDSVVVLLDQALAIQQEQLDQARREQEEYARFLNPIQRAQLAIAWRRLQMQIEGVRGRMMGPGRRQGQF